MKITLFATLGLSAVVLTGCGGSSPNATGATTPPAAVAIPATLFASAAPTGAIPLAEAKASAQPGERIVFLARVGGRRDPFVPDRAVFFVADASIKSCDEIPGDTCQTPWDYCCETPESKLRNLATVQIVDAAGLPLKRSVRDEHDLAPLRTVYVTGTVAEADASGLFVVNAESIFVEAG